MKFSVVIPFKDSPQERIFAAKSIPAAIALKPDELVIGVDSPASEELLGFVKGLAERESFDGLRVVEVSRSAGWKFHLACVIWECYAECHNDAILLSNIDVVLRPAVLSGLERLRQDGAALVCFPEKMLVDGPRAAIKYMFVKRYLQTHDAPSGVFWVDRPQMLEDVKLSRLKSIDNGIDTCIITTMMANEAHKSIYVREFAADSLDITNPDLPWRQFQKGVWLYASLERVQKERLERIRDSRTAWKRRLMDKLLYRFPRARILLLSFATQRPWIVRGYSWAQKHETHAAVTEAKRMTFDEYVMTGTRHIKDIDQWSEHGRTGTGFG